MTTNQPKASRAFVTRRTWRLVAVLLGLVLGWVFFHRPLDRALAVHLLLDSNSPREEVFEQLASQSNDPVEFLNRCWDTGKIVHRELVASFLKDKALANPPWFARAEPLLLAASTDADQSVRELALAGLEAGRSPQLFACSKAQLEDVDPMVRLLGLEYLRKTNPRQAVPVVMRLLDDSDLRVVTAAEAALRRWSGQDFGVRQRMALPTIGNPQSGGSESANLEAIRRGVEQRKQWWQLHATEYAAAPERPAAPARADYTRAPAPDFTLKDLNGRKVRLADFRGKVVLINFWATWCTACIEEIPDLVTLQNKMGDRVAILGVALDGVPAEDGHAPESGTPDEPAPSIKAVRAKVARAVKDRGINYTILLDPKSSAGSQFNGGELPTTVLLDPAGRVRRRFIGERNVKVFEAMVAQARR